jgi:superfamily II DNA or RNA helicase
MPFDALPLVDVGDIIRLVGQTSFQRGRSYARSGSVHDVEWDSETGTLVSAVHGSLPNPYLCRVQLAPTGSALRRPLSSTCTCPVTFDCKHVAATLIEANSMYIQHAEDDRIQRASDLRGIPRPSKSAPPHDPDWPAVAAIFDPELSPPPASGLPPLGSRTSGSGSGSVDVARKSVPRWKAALGAGLEGLPATDGDAGDDAAAGSGSGTSMWLPPREAPRPVPLALQFELRELVTRRGARWGAPVTRPASPDEPGSRRKKVRRLGVRPVMKSASGNWVRGSLGWNSMTSSTGQFTLEPEQRLWFAQLAGLYAATDLFAHGPSPEWILLDDFQSPLLWPLLEQADRIGVELVGPKKTSTIRVGSSVELRIDASTEGVAGTARTPAAVQLLTRLAIDGESQDLAGSGAIGTHGVYATTLGEDGGAFSCTIAPTDAPLSAAQRALFDRAPSLTVPGKDVPEFLTDYYPALRRTVRVTSDDASVRLPEFVPPVLVLTARFQPQNLLELVWEWEYRHGETTSRLPLRRGTGTSAAENTTTDTTTTTTDIARDDAVETEVLRRVETTLAAIPAAAPTLSPSALLEPLTTLVAHAAAHFADRALPSLSTLAGLRIDIEGDRPQYQELTETPQLSIKTEQTDHRDWFDLGVTVTIEGRDVPFEPLFAALSAGADTLLLEDNSYLSLEQDVFADLKRLIDEASTLQEWKAKPSISRYQASLWSELEQLAGDTEQASAWRESVTGLLELDAVAPVPLPAGIDATMRPYQQDGFNWLVFLWQHQLGGVLADDMGLGKTLQTLALITHAMDQRVANAGAATSTAPSSPAPSSTAPFLVVAPTSVVSNWVSEAGRFAPGLTVRGVTTTQKKGRMSLAELFVGADVVVTSYALFRLDFPAYQAQEWAGLILDEAQFAKNPASHANRCATELSAPFKLAITGTPMENSLTDLWSLFSIVAPGLFPTLRTFTEEYVRPIAKGDNADLVARLRRRIKPLMLRRTKDLVAADLPAKQEQVLTIDLAPKHRKLYDTYLQRERKKLLGLMDDFDKNRFQVFRSLTLLRMLSLDASLVDDAYSDIPSSKLDALFEQLEDVVAENHRALIFSQFTSFLKKAAERLDAAGIPYAYLDGSTLRRGAVIASFKEGDAPVFLISLKAGGFGLNLTEADYVFLLDPWWNPASESQAVDRTHRIGQNKSVMVYRMISAGTIEEKVMELKAKKSRLFDAVMDDDAVFSSALTADDIRGLLD